MKAKMKFAVISPRGFSLRLATLLLAIIIGIMVALIFYPAGLPSSLKINVEIQFDR